VDKNPGMAGPASLSSPLQLLPPGSIDSSVKHDVASTAIGKDVVQSLWRIATWNVRSLKSDEKLALVLDAFKEEHLDMLLVTETHIAEHVELESGDMIFLNKGMPLGCTAQCGVGFLANKKWLTAYDWSFTAYSERVAKLSLVRDSQKSSFIVCYAPTEMNGSEEEMAEFYGQLSLALQPRDDNEMIILGGDWNCRIGAPTDEEGHVTGKWCGRDVTSPRGETLLDFCSEHQLRVANRYFKHPLRHRCTWTHPATKRRETLDFFLSNVKGSRHILDIKSRPHRNCGSDHDLLICVIECTESKVRRKAKGPFKKPKLAGFDQRILIKHKGHFKQALGRLLDNCEPGWSNTEATIIKAVETCCETDKAQKQKSWFDEARATLKPLVSALTRAKNNYRRNPDKEGLKEALKKAKDAVRNHLLGYREERSRLIMSQIDEAVASDDQHKAKLLIAELRRSLKIKGLRDFRDLRSLGDKQFAEHLQKVFSESPDNCSHESLIMPQKLDVSIPSGPPTLSEARKAIATLKNHRAGGENELVAETFKAGCESLAVKMVKDMALLWPLTDNDECVLPASWTNSIVITLYKNKGDRKDPNNYRGIFLLDTAGKILAKILNERLREIMSQYVNEEQYGFRCHRSTVQSIFVLKQIQQAARYRSQGVIAAFIDLEKAFDSVPRKVIWTTLAALGVPGRLINVIKALHTNNVGKVGEQSFTMARGVKQGCVLGPALFNLVFQLIIDNANLTGGLNLTTQKNDLGVPSNIAVNIVHGEYADDLYLLADSEEALQKNLDSFNNACRRVGINISTSKTKVMWLAKSLNNTQRASVKLDGAILEEVDFFQYLGQFVHQDGSISHDVGNRIKAARSKLRSISDLLASSRLSIGSKVKLIKVYVLSTLYYGAETWNTTARDEDRLNAFLHLCRLRAMGKNYYDKVCVVEAQATVPLPTARHTLSKRRLSFLASLHSQQAPLLPVQALAIQFEHGKRIGGRRVQAWDRRLEGDLQFFNGNRLIPMDINTIVQIGKRTNVAGRKKELKKLFNVVIHPQQAAPRLVGNRVLNIKCGNTLCNRLFATRKEMYRHRRNDHNPLGTAHSQEYKCPIESCFRSYKVKGWLDKHMLECHSAAHSSPLTPVQNTQSSQSLEPNPLSNKEASAELNSSMCVTGTTCRSCAKSASSNIAPTSESAVFRSFTEYDIAPNLLSVKKLIMPERPPWKCPFQGCAKVTSTRKGLANHSTRDHDWSLETGGAKRHRAH
jgi:hypothetical protein